MIKTCSVDEQGRCYGFRVMDDDLDVGMFGCGLMPGEEVELPDV